jgi:hypothetical protein
VAHTPEDRSQTADEQAVLAYRTLAVRRQSVDLYRQLYERHPSRYRDLFAPLLQALASDLRMVGDDSAARGSSANRMRYLSEDRGQYASSGSRNAGAGPSQQTILHGHLAGRAAVGCWSAAEPASVGISRGFHLSGQLRCSAIQARWVGSLDGGTLVAGDVCRLRVSWRDCRS